MNSDQEIMDYYYNKQEVAHKEAKIKRSNHRINTMINKVKELQKHPLQNEKLIKELSDVVNKTIWKYKQNKKESDEDYKITGICKRCCENSGGCIYCSYGCWIKDIEEGKIGVIKNE